jgi:hypothetical protein
MNFHEPQRLHVLASCASVPAGDDDPRRITVNREPADVGQKVGPRRGGSTANGEGALAEPRARI